MLDTETNHRDEDTQAERASEAALDAYSRVVSGVADRVGPAVVRVEPAEGDRRGGTGSGVIIAGDGLVLTNSHVVGGAKRVRLKFAEGGDTAGRGARRRSRHRPRAAPRRSCRAARRPQRSAIRRR